MVLPGTNRENLWIIQKVNIIRLQAVEQIKNNQSQSLMISFNQTKDILSDLGIILLFTFLKLNIL
jgi:hypothetical protein